MHVYSKILYKVIFIVKYFTMYVYSKIIYKVILCKILYSEIL